MGGRQNIPSINYLSMLNNTKIDLGALSSEKLCGIHAFIPKTITSVMHSTQRWGSHMETIIISE